MSITKDFEGLTPFRGISWNPTDVVELLIHTRALETMLKKLEFSDDDYGCPECGNWSQTGHRPDCQLAKLLEGVE